MKIMIKALVLFIALILQGCSNGIFQGEPKWEFPKKLGNSYLIPVGRKEDFDNELEVMINDKKYDFSIYTDLAMGNWIVIPKQIDHSSIKIKIKNSTKSTGIQPIDTKNAELWTKPGSLIDSDNPNIIKTSIELKQQQNTHNLIASEIQKYVRDKIIHKDFRGHFSKKASETLIDKFGTCVNRSRLFVALCRASGIPARTVWGYFYILPGANKEGHHEWSEYLNDDNQWIALEFDKRLYEYKNITKPYIGHIDLIYAAEENPIPLLVKNNGSELLYISEEGNWRKATFGYKIIENNYPLSLTVENNFNIK